MKYLIFTILCIQSFTGIAQDKSTILTINPYGNDLTKTKLKYDSKVKFKITHVNSFKIEGTNSVSKESISFDVPEQFAKPLTEKTDNTIQQLKNGGDFLKGTARSDYIRAIENLSLKQDSINDLKKEFIKNYNCFIKTLNKLAIYTSVDAYIDNLLTDTFIPDVETLKANLLNYMAGINDEDTVINHLRKKGKEALDDLTNCYIQAKGAYDDLAKKMKAEKVQLTGELSTKDKNVILKIDSALVTLELKKIFEKEIEFLTAKFDAINPESKRTEIVNKINIGVDYFYKVKNAAFEVYTDGQQLDEDIVTITPELKNAKGDVVKEFSPVRIKTSGGLKVDFSSGYLLSFRGDENYATLYDSSGIIGVQKNGSDHVKHAVGAMLNAYMRTGNDFNVGISFGISVPTDDKRIGFYGGLSALMLEKHRLIISAGIAYNKISLLNTANLTKDAAAEKITGKETYKFSNGDYKEIKYDELYRPAFFVGITYNIFTVKK